MRQPPLMGQPRSLTPAHSTRMPVPMPSRHPWDNPVTPVLATQTVRRTHVSRVCVASNPAGLPARPVSKRGRANHRAHVRRWSRTATRWAPATTRWLQAPFAERRANVTVREPVLWPLQVPPAGKLRVRRKPSNPPPPVTAEELVRRRTTCLAVPSTAPLPAAGCAARATRTANLASSAWSTFVVESSPRERAARPTVTVSLAFAATTFVAEAPARDPAWGVVRPKRASLMGSARLFPPERRARDVRLR